MIRTALLLFLTVTIGTIVAGFWSDPRRGTDRRSHRFAVAHVGIGLTAVAAWVVYLIGRADAVGTASTAALFLTALLGTGTLLSTHNRDRRVPHEQRAAAVPALALLLHGAAAAAAITSAVAVVM